MPLPLSNGVTEIYRELRILVSWIGAHLAGDSREGRSWLWLSAMFSTLVLIWGIYWSARPAVIQPGPTVSLASLVPPAPLPPPEPVIDLMNPVRPIPDRFPRNTRKPVQREGNASVSIKDYAFHPDRHLIEIDDDRVWWESDNDRGDTENDHQIHRSMEVPLKRLIELVSQEGGTLKVQDTYRAQGIHSATSLHKQGRAVDLTCDELGLERVAQLAWAAGFDWVYHEAPKRGGHHVHASVKP